MWGTCELDNEWLSSSKVVSSKETSFLDWMPAACIMYHRRPVRWNTVCDLLSTFCSPAFLPLYFFSYFFWALLTQNPHEISLTQRKLFFVFFFIFPTLTFLNQTTSKVQHKLSAVWKLLSGLGMDFLLELMGVEIKEVKYRVKSFCLFARYSSLPLYHTWPCHQPSSVCRNTLSDFIYDLCKTLSNVPLWFVSSHVFSAWCLESSKIFTSQPWVLCYYWPS